jgi:hypothetical protein
MNALGLLIAAIKPLELLALLLQGCTEVRGMNPSTQYSTLAVAAPRRFDYWKEVVCRHCLAADSKPLSQSSFDGSLAVNTVGDLDICSLSAPLHYWERSEQHLRSGPSEDLWLGFSRNGHGQIEQGGRKANLAAGNLFLYDATQAFRFSFGGTENHLVRIPRALLVERLPRIADYTAMVLDERRPGVIPLREMLRQAASAPASLQDEAISNRYSSALLDLLVISLELQDLKISHDELDLYGRIMKYIQRHLTEPDLSIEVHPHRHPSLRPLPEDPRGRNLERAPECQP